MHISNTFLKKIFTFYIVNYIYNSIKTITIQAELIILTSAPNLSGVFITETAATKGLKTETTKVKITIFLYLNSNLCLADQNRKS